MQACALRLSFFLLLLVASSYATTHYVDTTNSIYSVLSLSSVLAGDTVIINNGTYPYETAYTLDKNLTIIVVGEVNVSVAGTPAYWLNIKSNVTMGGSGSLTLNNYGIVVGEGMTLTQNVSIEVVDTKYSAMTVGELGVWDQLKDFTVTHDSSFDQDQEQIMLGIDSRWTQNGALSIRSVNATGVQVLGGGLWRQDGPAQINVTSELGGRGVHLAGGSVWLQGASVSINVVADRSNCVGVLLASQSTWTATAPTTIVGTYFVVGVALLGDAVYNQGGTLDISIVGSLRDTLPRQDSAGVRFAARLGTTWQQLASTTITIQGDAVGIDLVRGGQWNQQVPVNIATVAQGSSSAITIGIVCEGSSTCCNRIQSPLYLPNIIFTTALRTAGVRDDCPKASASPTPLAIRAVVVNTTATFANSTPSISIAGTASSAPSSGGTGTREVAVQLSLTDLLVGNSSATPTDYTVTQQVTNSTSGAANTTTYVYAAHLDNATSVAQAYTFFAQKATTAFAGTTFTVGAGSLKWSINLTTTAVAPDASDGGVGAGTQGLTLRYQLASLLNINASSSVVPEAEAVVRRPNTPQNQMTTYIVRLDDNAVAQVELFDVALVDDQLTFINHSLTVVTATTNATTNGTTARSYVLELQLPAFNQSLFYDPSLGLGVLLGGSTKADGSGSDDNTALIVATAVAIPVAVVVVAGVVAVALLVAWWRKRDRSALELDDVLHDHDKHDSADDSL